ncbi:MAG: CHAT domain-containing protein [Leptolyngbyaceae cyanobacterium bins.302]|nr:CHAT domain-containing protein [Leptolyngbyaceae cyanobacterium bins.302]
MLISRRTFTFVTLVLLTAWLTLTPGIRQPVVGNQSSVQDPVVVQSSIEDPQGLLQQGREFYQAGKFDQALQPWQRAATIAASQSDRLTQAAALSNVALAHQQLGAWTAATEAMTTSLKVLGVDQGKTAPKAGTPAYQQVLAQVLNTQGKLQFAAGQFELALTSWQQATDRYTATQDATGATQSLINQTQALKALGQHRRANTILEPLYQARAKQPAPLQLAILLNYGDNLRLLGRLMGDAPNSQTVLQQGLDLANQMQSASNAASFLLSLGNTAHALQQLQATRFADRADELRQFYQEALRYHQQVTQAAELSPSLKKLQALVREQTAQLASPFVSAEQRTQAQALSKQIQFELDRLPANPTTIFAYLQLAENQIQLDGSAATLTTVQLLDAAARQAESIGDFQLQSYALWSKLFQQALQSYQQAAEFAGSDSTTYLNALLNQQSLLLEVNTPRHRTQAEALSPQIQAQLDRLPLSHSTFYARIHFAQNLLKFGNAQTQSIATQLLETVAAQAERIGDLQAKSYALGYWGAVYEQNQQWQAAQTITQQALSLAKAVDANHLAYRWQWQLGRLLKVQNDPPAAIAAYSQAVESLNLLRRDLATLNTDNADVQFSFRANAEPVYLELVELLLQSDLESPSAQKLEKARSVIESLQIAELENFFQQACATVEVDIEGVDPKAAIVYPIVLKDRLDIILSLYDAQSPQRVRLRHYSTPIPGREVEQTTNQFRQALIPSAPLQDRFILGQRLYNWLIRPAAADLAQAGVKTLVFIMNGNLRNIPMAALHDGNQFLVQKYAVALTPGLRLINPQPLARQNLQALVAGLTEATQGFPPLPSVATEVNEIQATIPSRVILNENLTNKKLEQELRNLPVNAIHLATHGQFSSNADQTFILTWDQKLNVRQFDSLLRAVDKSDTTALELLVLSACQTASGDKRAALGLAGVAVRSGARSTVASLWPVNDETTADFMTMFYRALKQKGISKADALSTAQLQLLAKHPSPYYWAPFVLVGNWL